MTEPQAADLLHPYPRARWCRIAAGKENRAGTGSAHRSTYEAAPVELAFLLACPNAGTLLQQSLLLTSSCPLTCSAKPACFEIEVSSMPKKAASLPLQVARVPKKAAVMPQKGATLPVKAASLPLSTACMPLFGAKPALPASSRRSRGWARLSKFRRHDRNGCGSRHACHSTFMHAAYPRRIAAGKMKAGELRDGGSSTQPAGRFAQ